MNQPRSQLIDDTDQCVKCGLCLPHCPTYVITQDENESPRGRLSLIDGWAKGIIQPTRSFQSHLDHCLLCRKCEVVCPAQVPYGKIMDGFRATQISSSSRPASKSKAFRLLLSKRPKGMNALLRLYQKTGIRWLFRKLGLLKWMGVDKLDDLLPNQILQNTSIQRSNQESGPPTIALFTGCATNLVDARTVHDALRLMAHCGLNVDIPKQQTCCGAIEWHAGLRDQAKQRAKQNIEAFQPQDFDHIVSLASGCGATLQEYSELDDSPASIQMAGRVLDISSLLLKYADRMRLKPLSEPVWLHTPCTLKNVMHQHDAPLRLLKHIPDIQVTPFAEPNHCCGAAGTHMLNFPERAEALRGPLIEQIKTNPPRYLLTSNIGCAMHLRAGIRQAGLHTEVLHPVSFLAQQLLDESCTEPTPQLMN